jgi:hypothetical protein
LIGRGKNRNQNFEMQIINAYSKDESRGIRRELDAGKGDRIISSLRAMLCSGDLKEEITPGYKRQNKPWWLVIRGDRIPKSLQSTPHRHATGELAAHCHITETTGIFLLDNCFEKGNYVRRLYPVISAIGK